MSFATLNVPLSVAGTVFLSVFDSARTHPPGSRVAVFVAGEEDAIPLTVGLNQQIRITTFLGGEEQETTDPSASQEGQVPIVLSLLDTPTVLAPANPGPRAEGFLTRPETGPAYRIEAVALRFPAISRRSRRPRTAARH